MRGKTRVSVRTMDPCEERKKEKRKRAQSGVNPSLPSPPPSLLSLLQREVGTYKLIQRPQRRKLGILNPNPNPKRIQNETRVSFRFVSLLKHELSASSLDGTDPESLQVFGSSSDDVHAGWFAGVEREEGKGR